MSKHVLSVLGAVILTLGLAALALAQETTTTVTKTVQNPDGTYTVIEYPAKKEVKINLTPVNVTGATGVATILRDDDGTRIKLNLTSVPADVSALTLYAVDDQGMVTALGPVAISNGTGTFTTTTPLSKFMLVASPEPALTAYDANTKIFFRSAVPEGFAVIPMTTSPSGEKVAAVAAPTTTAPTTVVTAPTTTTPTTVVTAPTTTAPTTVVTAPSGATAVVTQTSYPAPMLNIPAYKKGDDTKIKVDFAGALTGARANVFITPRKDGPTEVKMRLHDLKETPQGNSIILWAVSPDGKYVKLGQVANTPGRNEAEIKSETTLADFRSSANDGTGHWRYPCGTGYWSYPHCSVVGLSHSVFLVRATLASGLFLVLLVPFCGLFSFVSNLSQKTTTRTQLGLICRRRSCAVASLPTGSSSSPHF